MQAAETSPSYQMKSTSFVNVVTLNGPFQTKLPKYFSLQQRKLTTVYFFLGGWDLLFLILLRGLYLSFEVVVADVIIPAIQKVPSLPFCEPWLHNSTAPHH